MSFVAECEQCGVIERGDFEAVGDAAEDHEQFHDVRVQRVATDGGEEIPEPIDWSYAAVVHGADVRSKCLAITGSGDCCTNNAYGDTLCGMHEDANDSDILEGAHQWARIEDGDDVIAVCVNCEDVWRGGTPALAVDCPDCPAGVGERCRDPDSMTAARLMPHPARRERGRELVEEYEYCDESPIPAVEDGQKRLVTDGGIAAGCYRRQCVNAVRTYAGVGDQDNTCDNGTPGCPGPDAANGELPCSACFLRGGAD
jgi:hypothetical protein